ncbi:MAG TPA: YfiR family protein [Candidatus Aminicenantes bacterium]|nr:YfiR family protein [Candidatus Aminicenantes bacterium]
MKLGRLNNLLFYFLIYGFLIFIFFIFCWSAVLSQALSAQVTAQHYTIQPEQELQLLIKVLKFERTLKSRAGDIFAIGVVNQKSYSLSSWIAADWLALNQKISAQQIKIEGLPIVIIEIDSDLPLPVLEDKLKQESVDFIYFPPLEVKTGPTIIKKICRLAEKLKIGTFTDLPEYLDYGVAIAFSFQENKLQIILNLPAARSQGLDFSANFLHLVNLRKGHDANH